MTPVPGVKTSGTGFLCYLGQEAYAPASYSSPLIFSPICGMMGGPAIIRPVGGRTTATHHVSAAVARATSVAAAVGKGHGAKAQ